MAAASQRDGKWPGCSIVIERAVPLSVNCILRAFTASQVDGQERGRGRYGFYTGVKDIMCFGSGIDTPRTLCRWWMTRAGRSTSMTDMVENMVVHSLW
jgi:hypothetical protein